MSSSDDENRTSTRNKGSSRRGDSLRQSDSRGSNYGRFRSRERNQGREHDQSRRHYRGYEDRAARGKGRSKHDNHDRFHSREHQRFSRYHDFDQDEKKKHGSRSPFHLKDKSGDQVGSCSPSHSGSDLKSKRTSGFDMAPPLTAMVPSAAVPAGQSPGITQAITGLAGTTLPFGTMQYGALPIMPAQAMTQLATRHARRVYVGGLPPMANEQTISVFFSQVMTAIGGNSAGPGDAVVNVYLNHEKKFAFVEMRTVEEASNAMALDGIIFEGVAVRVRRPTDYNPALAAALGPGQPSPHLNLAAVGLIPGAIGGQEGPDRIFVGGLPYHFTDAQIRELLETFGSLRGFDLVKDKDTGNSKGYGFCVYQDPTVTDIVCAALNGMKMGEKTLTVRRAATSGQSRPEQENILAQARQHIAIQKMALHAGGVNIPLFGTAQETETPTKVLCLTEAVTEDLLRDEEEYVEILEDMKEECSKFGVLVNVVIPRPKPDGEEVPGVGKVFLEYSDSAGCTTAKNALSGRKFGGNLVGAFYYPEDKFYNVDYGA